MCMSPHEMSNVQIDDIIQEYEDLRQRAEARGDTRYANLWQTYVDKYTALRKERAEAGVDVVWRDGRAVEVPIAEDGD